MVKRWVIPDIHGCWHTLRTLIENQIVPSHEDQLFFLGDYIDRGKFSKQVLDYLIYLQSEGYATVFIRGNHEDVLLRCYENQQKPTKIGFYTLQESWFQFGGEATLKSFGVEDVLQIPEHYISFLRTMPYFWIQEKEILVHAGLNFLIENPFSDQLAMLWAKNYTIQPQKIHHKRLIHGHTPKTFDYILQQLENSTYELCLDNGCVFYKEEGLGNLLALELNSHTLLVQPNLDKEK
ncbi:MAG: serine/threonine protein phosphatase [Microscillaceae bacterium]|nr:serine/threonine protein phosphatase [Microscillaceae bacterium]MDW8461269.1 metallophosphoesterase family protein [Cytophagales bacterium]